MFNKAENWKLISKGLKPGTFLYPNQSLDFIYYHTRGPRLLLSVAREITHSLEDKIWCIITYHKDIEMIGRCYTIDKRYFHIVEDTGKIETEFSSFPLYVLKIKSFIENNHKYMKFREGLKILDIDTTSGKIGINPDGENKDWLFSTVSDQNRRI